MTTVAELIAKLQTFPPETEVEVMREESHGWGIDTTFVPVDLDDMQVMTFPKTGAGNLSGRSILELRGV